MARTILTYISITFACFNYSNLSGQIDLKFSIDIEDSIKVELMDPSITYSISGLVLDQYGNSVAGADIILQGSTNKTQVSDEDGFFELDDLQSQQTIRISKVGHLDNKRQLREFHYFLKDSNQVFIQVQLPVLDIKYKVGKKGGEFTGPFSIQVPEGALNSDIEIEACLLPPGYLNLHDQKIHPSVLGSIHFEPSGLKFNKPISISIQVEQALNEQSKPAVLHYSVQDGETIREEISDPNLTITKNNWTFSISHFSDCQMVDKNTVIRKIPSSRKPDDSNLDGKVDDQDADRIVHLIGGTQSMEFNTTITSSQMVSKREGTSKARSSSDTHAQGGGASVKGVGASVEEEKTTSLSKEESEEYGIELAKEQSFSSTVTVSVGEYNDRCKMLFTLYDVQYVLKYVRVDLNKTELEHLKNNIGNDPPDDEGWHFRKVEGRSGVAVDRTLHEGMRLAVKVNDDGSMEVFVLSKDLIVRTLKGLKTSNCKDVNKSKIGSVKYYLYPPPSKNGAEIYSITYLGLRRGDSPEKIYRSIECGSEAKEEWSESRSTMEFKESSESTSKEHSSSVDVKAGVELELGGIIQIEGHASHKTEKSEQVSNRLHHGTNTVETDQTTFSLTIYNAHEEHESDHDLYGLYHVYEVRDWFYEFPNTDKITRSLKKRIRETKGSGDGRIQGELNNGQRVLLDEEKGVEYWYISGPPITVFRDAGKQLVRIEERPCVEEPPIEMPKEKELEERSSTTEDDRRTEAVPRENDSDKSSENEQPVLPKDQEKEEERQKMGEGSNLTKPVSQYGIGAGVGLAFPTNKSHEPSNGVEDLEDLIYSDPVIFQDVFDALGGDFFLGTLTGPAIIEKGDIGTDIGWTATGLFDFADLWEAEITYGQFTNDWTSRFPITVFDPVTSEPFRVNGEISMDVESNRLGVIVNRSFDMQPFAPFVGAGIQHSKRTLKSARANIEGVEFDVWSESDESQIGVLIQGGVDIHIISDLSARLAVQGAVEPHPSMGKFENNFIPAARILIHWGF